ncbi:Uu.00g146340.m01.CDS01 [Anthostomella pinea]|uniref:Uu.00g146340.m01.CDS01 n=1 Tax=Anthostomella pinea TaxID=933095 RepID=A0AAI8VR95_9PEZI|nr:Uu.00g146340.m01.CDS01 [Anthostomella pinea]
MPECNFFVRNGYCSHGDERLPAHRPIRPLEQAATLPPTTAAPALSSKGDTGHIYFRPPRLLLHLFNINHLLAVRLLTLPALSKQNSLAYVRIVITNIATQDFPAPMEPSDARLQRRVEQARLQRRVEHALASHRRFQRSTRAEQITALMDIDYHSRLSDIYDEEASRDLATKMRRLVLLHQATFEILRDTERLLYIDHLYQYQLSPHTPTNSPLSRRQIAQKLACMLPGLFEFAQEWRLGVLWEERFERGNWFLLKCSDYGRPTREAPMLLPRAPPSMNPAISEPASTEEMSAEEMLAVLESGRSVRVAGPLLQDAIQSRNLDDSKSYTITTSLSEFKLNALLWNMPDPLLDDVKFTVQKLNE